MRRPGKTRLVYDKRRRTIVPVRWPWYERLWSAIRDCFRQKD